MTAQRKFEPISSHIHTESTTIDSATHYEEEPRTDKYLLHNEGKKHNIKKQQERQRHSSFPVPAHTQICQPESTFGLQPQSTPTLGEHTWATILHHGHGASSCGDKAFQENVPGPTASPVA